MFIKKREHRIKADLLQILQASLHRRDLNLEDNHCRLKRDRFKPKGEFFRENEN